MRADSAGWRPTTQFLAALDTNNDGVISKDEWEAGKRDVDLLYEDTLIINVDKLTTECAPCRALFV